MKIKLRDLDDDVLNAIKGSYSPSAETQEILNQVNKLVSDVQSIKDTYITKDKTYTKDELKKLGSDLKKQIDSEISSNDQKYIQKQEGITESMLDGNLQYKVNARYNNVYAEAGSGEQNYEALKQQIFQLQRTINQLQVAVASAMKSGEQIPESSLPDSVRNMINNGVRMKNDKLSLDDFNINDKISLTNAINSDSSILSGKITAITDFILKSGEAGATIYATPTPDDPTSDYDQRKKNGICGTAKMILDNSVAACFNTDQVNAAKNARDKEDVMDSSGNVTKKQIPTFSYVADFSSANKYYSYDEASSSWKEHADALTRFCGQFIGNEDTHTLFYITPTEAMDISEYINAMSKEDPVDIVLAPNSSQAVKNSHAITRSLTLLIYDNENGSATKGKWLDAAPYGHLVIEDGQYTVYNDTDSQQRFMVVG